MTDITVTPTEPTPEFAAVAGPHATHIEALLRTPVPSSADIIAAVDAAAEAEEARHGD